MPPATRTYWHVKPKYFTDLFSATKHIHDSKQRSFLQQIKLQYIYTSIWETQ